MKKRIIALLLAALLTLSFAACTGGMEAENTPDASGASEGTAATEENGAIVATIFPAYDFARAVAGDELSVSLLISPGSEAHGYSPTLDEIAMVQACKLFVYTGGETDSWVDEQFKSGNIDTTAFKSIAMTDCVVLSEEQEELEAEDHEEGEQEEGEAEYDEHVWTSPDNAVSIINEICTQLSAIYPEKADSFRANADAYIALINTEDAVIREIVDTAKNKLLVFEGRFPFLYFCEYYNLEHIAAFAGCSGNTEISAGTLNELVNAVKDNDIPAVLCLEFSKQQAADAIVEATGCKKLELHSYHNVSVADFDNGVTYVDLMKRNAETLKEALN